MIRLPLLGGNWIEPHGGEEWSIDGEDEALFLTVITQFYEAGVSGV